MYALIYIAFLVCVQVIVHYELLASFTKLLTFHKSINPLIVYNSCQVVS